jgi:hypothetical protein
MLRPLLRGNTNRECGSRRVEVTWVKVMQLDGESEVEYPHVVERLIASPWRTWGPPRAMGEDGRVRRGTSRPGQARTFQVGWGGEAFAESRRPSPDGRQFPRDSGQGCCTGVPDWTSPRPGNRTGRPFEQARSGTPRTTAWCHVVASRKAQTRTCRRVVRDDGSALR